MTYEINVTHLGDHTTKKGIEKSWFKVAMCEDVTLPQAEQIMAKLRAIFTDAVSIDLYQTKRERLNSSAPALLKGKR